MIRPAEASVEILPSKKHRILKFSRGVQFDPMQSPKTHPTAASRCTLVNFGWRWRLPCCMRFTPQRLDRSKTSASLSTRIAHTISFLGSQLCLTLPRAPLLRNRHRSPSRPSHDGPLVFRLLFPFSALTSLILLSRRSAALTRTRPPGVPTAGFASCNPLGAIARVIGSPPVSFDGLNL